MKSGIKYTLYYKNEIFPLFFDSDFLELHDKDDADYPNDNDLIDDDDLREDGLDSLSTSKDTNYVHYFICLVTRAMKAHQNECEATQKL